jgi:hypothetical protein
MNLMLRAHCIGLWWLMAATVRAHAQENAISPLQTVIDGRDAARTSTLTEQGMTTMAQQAANITLFVCGALAIILTAMALFQLYKAGEMEGMHIQANEQRAAVWKLVIAGLVSIPAIVAAILPYTLLGPS